LAFVLEVDTEPPPDAPRAAAALFGALPMVLDDNLSEGLGGGTIHHRILLFPALTRRL